MIFDLTSIKKFTNSYPKLQKNVLEKMPLFAFIHADWCGHCKTVLPEWEKFIKKMKSGSAKTKDVAILDITDDVFNYILKEHSHDFLADVLGKSVVGYPTLFYMDQKNEKGHHESTIYSYTGTRTAENFNDFIKEHQKNKTRTSLEIPKSKTNSKTDTKTDTKTKTKTKDKTKDKKDIKEKNLSKKGEKQKNKKE